MKKILITLIALMAVAFSAKAQLYVGGSVGFGVVSGGGTTSASWNLTPEVGYDFNEKIAAGASLNLTGTHQFAWSLNPYFRWKFANLGTAHFLSDFMVSAGTSGSVFTWGISANPGVSFDLTDKFSFLVRCSLLGVSGASDQAVFHLNILQGAQIGLFYHF